MNIVIINPRYPYGKDQIYLNGSVTSVAARLLAMGHEVDIIDLNIDRLETPHVHTLVMAADLIGISLTGAPHIPGVIELTQAIRVIAPSCKIMLGGQVIKHLTTVQFRKIFGDTVIQIGDGDNPKIKNSDEFALARLLGCEITDIPKPNVVPFSPVYRRMGEDRMSEYLRHEMTLVVSQGCRFKCKFCAAEKRMVEGFRALGHFQNDLTYMVEVAKRHNIEQLNFYASSLDFFQNPDELREYLEILAHVQEEHGVKIRVRCLSCMTSFLQARHQMKDFDSLIHHAGVWCVGFGSDGTDEAVWKAEQKPHNSVAKLIECMETCHSIGLRAELLMVFGFPEDTAWTLWKTVLTCIWSVTMWNNVIIRPYLAKTLVPGNDGWKAAPVGLKAFTDDPRKFTNIDFCAIGSRLTHPHTIHRWLCNAAYLTLCTLFTPFGKCTTSPLLPGGESGLYGAIAKLINRFIPFDR